MASLYGLDGTTEPDRLAVLTLHLWDSYQEPWGASRRVFYNTIFQGTPCFVHDGLYDAWPIGTYMAKFLTQKDKPTPVTMSLAGEEVGVDEYNVRVNVCLDPGADPLDLRIYTVMAEDHYPAVPTYYRNSFRVAAENEDISLTEGQCVQVYKTLVVAPETEQANFRVISWAQEPNASFPAEVFQSVVDPYPFSDLADLDGNGTVGFSDLLMILAAWGPCDGCIEDLDGSGDVGFSDLLVVLAGWS